MVVGLRMRHATYSKPQTFHGASFFMILRNRIPTNISTYTVGPHGFVTMFSRVSAHPLFFMILHVRTANVFPRH